MRAFLLLLSASLALTACDCSGDRRPGLGPTRDAGGTEDAPIGIDGAGGCAAGMLACAGECIDVSWDPSNCGACGNFCREGEVCSEGACGTTCNGARPTRCGDLCVDVMTNPLHCGACRSPCADGLFCEDGVCRLSCGEFADQCGKVCTDVRTDPLNCGACGVMCPVPPHATATCMDSACGFVCDTGWGDCNLLPEDGCETSLLDDVDNCGMCGFVCPVPDHATATCVGGICSFECVPPYLPGLDGVCEAPPMTGCHDGPARILVFGPGGRIGPDLIAPGGAVITVASEAMWAAMTTAEFGNYDIIWFDGANCGSATTASTWGVAEDTIATWGPAITGRIVLMIGDPDYHSTEGTPWSRTWYNNNANWLKQNGRNADGGHTSLFFNWGCTVFTSNSMGMVPGRGTPEMFTAAFGGPLVTDVTNYCGGITAPTGVGHPVTRGMDSYWSCAFHGGFSSYPPGYTVLSNGGTLGVGNCAIARDPFPCEP